MPRRAIGKMRRKARSDISRIENVVKPRLAKSYRKLLGRWTGLRCIGVTGSCGKTTTKELIASILATQGATKKSTHLFNAPHLVVETVLAIAPWHRFCVHELGTQHFGQMDESVKVFQPHIGVVTHIGLDHRTTFRTKERVAMEKGRLIETLPGGGVAVLNADDPHVLAMRERTGVRILTYGLSAEAMVRAEEITGAWPQRLSLLTIYGNERARVQTKLIGEHWVHAVLAALATGIANGIPLQQAARALESVEPSEGRMSLHETPDGVTFIRDDWKASMWTIPASLQFMQKARATRKVVIIGTISDYPGKSSPKYRNVARQALEVADRVIFVGKMARHVRKLQGQYPKNKLIVRDSLYEVDQFLSGFLNRGYLVGPPRRYSSDFPVSD